MGIIAIDRYNKALSENLKALFFGGLLHIFLIYSK